MHFLIFFGRAAFAKAVATASEHDAQDECTPKCSSPSLGVGESMNRVVEGQVRTVRSALEAVLQMPVAIGFAVKTSVVIDTNWVLMRFLVRLDGFTACKKVKKRACNSDVAEMVMLKEAGKHMKKAGRPLAWTCVGKSDPGDEHHLLALHGV